MSPYSVQNIRAVDGDIILTMLSFSFLSVWCFLLHWFHYIYQSYVTGNDPSLHSVYFTTVMDLALARCFVCEAGICLSDTDLAASQTSLCTSERSYTLINIIVNVFGYPQSCNTFYVQQHGSINNTWYSRQKSDMHWGSIVKTVVITGSFLHQQNPHQ